MITYDESTFQALGEFTDQISSTDELAAVIDRITVEGTTAEAQFFLSDPDPVMEVAFQEDAE